MRNIIIKLLGGYTEKEYSKLQSFSARTRNKANKLIDILNSQKNISKKLRKAIDDLLTNAS